MTTFRYGYLVLNLFGIFLFMSCKAQEIFPIFPCGEYLDSPYGVTTHITRELDRYDYKLRDSELQILHKNNVSNIRVDLDYTSLKNSDVFTGKTILREAINSTRKNKVHLLGILKNVEYNVYNWIHQKEYDDYLNTLINEYGKDIHYWEYLNEADLIKDDLDLAKHYYETLRYAYIKIKQNYPQDIVLFSGIAGVKSPFMNDVMALGATAYFDVMNFHCYRSPETSPELYSFIRRSMDLYGWRKPVWLTECGMSTEGATEEERACKEQLQARWIARLHLIAFAYGIEKVFIYNLRSYEENLSEKEDNFGLLHNNLTEKLSMLAYKTFLRFCPTMSSRPHLTILDNGIYQAEWITPKGHKIIAVWTKDGSMGSYVIQKSEGAKIYNYLGARVKFKASITVDNSVQYIVYD